MKRITIEGMMCEHCANAVKNALEELGAKNVEVNLDGGYADADINASIDEISARIAEEDFQVTEVSER